MAIETLERPEPRPEHFKWTRERFYQAVEAGVIGEDEKVELIGGELITEGMADRMGQKSLHGWAMDGIAEMLGDLFGLGFYVRRQLPLSLGFDSDPEPDCAVVTGTRHDYKDAHPSTALLIVEVADSTLRFDRYYKASLYASVGISDYWVLNLPDRQLEIFRTPLNDDSQPFGYRYATVVVKGNGDRVSPLAMPGGELEVASLLP